MGAREAAVAAFLAALLFATPATERGQGGVHWSEPQTLRVSGKLATTILVVRFADDVTSEQVIAAMQRRNVRPAEDRHCAAYAQRRDGLFVCLSSVEIADGKRFVRVWYTNLGLEQNEFNPWGGNWPRNVEFLAIQDPTKKQP